MLGGLDQVWDLPGVEVPHDLEVVAAPVWSGAGRQRPVALTVTETRMQDSRLLKFILLPDGELFTYTVAQHHAMWGRPVPNLWLQYAHLAYEQLFGIPIIPVLMEGGVLRMFLAFIVPHARRVHICGPDSS